jgi:tetratricopeptide (TPR) repeat protein
VLHNATARLQSDWLALHATTLGALRDFDRAEQWLARAEAVDPANPWVQVERATLMEAQDRYEEALIAAQRALELHPWFRAAVQDAAHTLILMDRDDEALALLKEASARLECGWIEAQLAQLQAELGQYAEARQSLERYARLTPLMEKETEQWLNGRFSDLAYLCGDYESALKYAEATEHPFFKLTSERMREADETARRVQLPVGFVRQHYLTCAPATLAMISRYWRQPADHLSVAEAICYDGTPAHSERRWAEEHGWAAREFCVNQTDAVGLIDRGIVFTLTTVDPGNAHLQAVIGYDTRRGTLLIRDPYLKPLGEAAMKELLERYRSSGPRGMAMAPQEQAALLDDLKLLEAEIYDQFYRAQRALEIHDRELAGQIVAAMTQAHADHRLTLQAQVALASYDADPGRMLAMTEQLIAQFPEDANLKLSKISLLRSLARREERLEFLRSVCEQKDSDPLFWQQYAQELGDDTRAHPQALRLLRRAFRQRPLEAGNFYLLANIFWQQRRFNEALELYRFAACLKETDEGMAHSYFVASRHFKQTEVAFEFLESRCRRFGKRSGAPTRTLFQAREMVGQEAAGLDALRAGMALRPDDGELMLFSADAFARQGDFGAAPSLLAAAEGKAPRSDWLRTAAGIAAYRGELTEALSLWRQVDEAEPMAVDTARSIAQLLAETESRAAAIEYLRQKTARFAHNYALSQLLTEWLRDDPAEAETALRQLIEIDPADAWARRELAMTLCRQRKFAEGFAEIEIARELEPDNPSYYCILGRLSADSGRIEEAKTAYRSAIRLSVDTDYAINNLILLSPTAQERRTELEFIRQELMRQVIFGDGLLAWRDQATSTLEPEECLKLLQAALTTRPDLWQSWSAVVCQMTEMELLDEALSHARQAVERFPLMPRLWYDLALVCRSRLDRSGEIEALRQALGINPGWGLAAQQLADVYQRDGQLPQAAELLERATTHTPLDPYNHGCLADVWWKSGKKEEALERVRRAITLEPGYEWGWQALRDWSRQLEHPQLAIECAREITRQRSGEARSWLILARTLAEPDDLSERLEALDRAAALNPRAVDAYTLRAQLLAEAGRFDEALAACRPEVFGAELPPELRSAAAWIEAQRGDRPEAIRQMQGLVADEPNYYSGWSRLADWYSEAGDGSAYLEAAQAMARIAPQFAIALGYLGDARLANDDRGGAKEVWRRAMMLDPEYQFASRSLFDLQLEDNETEAAATTLEFLRKHIGGNLTQLRAIRLLLSQRDFDGAAAEFRALCLSPQADSDHLEAAAGAERDKRWQKLVDKVLNETLTHPEANAETGALWARRMRLFRVGWRLKKLPVGSEVWRRASEIYLEALAARNFRDSLRRFVRKYAEALRHHSDSWGTVCYALVTVGDYRGAVRWADDWRQREDARPWMLWNYALALRYLKREREAYVVGKEALNLPEDHLSNSHRLMLALDDALEGEMASAKSGHEQINASSLREWDRFVYEMLGDLFNFHYWRERGRDTSRENISHLLRLAQEAKFFRPGTPLVKAHRRIVMNIARTSEDFPLLMRVCLGLSWLYLVRSLR